MAWLPAFSKGVYEAGFGRGEDIADDAVLARVAATLGLDFARLSASTQLQDVKDRLKSRTAEAMQLGIFGAPTFQTSDGEIFWGDDRLEQAISHSSGL
jgi:2-hydroxychromene-2-carboxylate isomerase